MPQTVAVKTTMYSVDEAGRVVVHHFPFNANDAYGMKKAQKFIDRGFTFNDPRLVTARVMPEVKVVEVVDMERPVGLTDAPAQDVVVEATPQIEVSQSKEVSVVEAEKTGREIQAGEVVCPECGRLCKSEFGLKVHKRRHKNVN